MCVTWLSGPNTKKCETDRQANGLTDRWTDYGEVFRMCQPAYAHDTTRGREQFCLQIERSSIMFSH